MSFMLLGILNSQASGGAAGAFDLLETTTLTSSASSVTFSGLGAYSDYKHLQIRAVGRCTDASQSFPLQMYFNGVNTGGAYSSHELRPYNSNVQSLARTSKNTIEDVGYFLSAQATASKFGSIVIDILDYASTSKNTTTRSLNAYEGDTSKSTWGILLGSGAWYNTSAVSSITIEPFFQSGGFAANSRFSLYGIKG